MNGGSFVSVAANYFATAERLVRKCRLAQALLTVQALSDCNRYCKVDSGRLQESARGNLKTGVLSWNTPYARAAYYTGKPDRGKNPHAHLMWAHIAAKKHGKSWEALVRKELL